MKPIKQILKEQYALNLNNTQKGIIATIHIAATPNLAYDSIIGYRNAVESSQLLQKMGYLLIDHGLKKVSLTGKGEDVLMQENITDEMGELTERGQSLIDRYRESIQDWKTFESFKYFV